MNHTINIETWFSDREMSYCPKHFVMASTPLTQESKNWVLERLHGRFYIQQGYWKAWRSQINIPSYRNLASMENIPYFEDPSEATLYELTWS